MENVVSIFSKKEEEVKPSTEGDISVFDEIQRANQIKKAKIAEQRRRDNESVKRSYRLDTNKKK